jgi:hypothetical protein
MKLTFEEFMKILQGSDTIAKEILYDHYAYGWKERERQREKSRRTYNERKKKNQPTVDENREGHSG